MERDEIIRRLKNLVVIWRQEAMEMVPPIYAERDLHYKYFKLDNEAAGVNFCADVLEELIEKFEN